MRVLAELSQEAHHEAHRRRAEEQREGEGNEGLRGSEAALARRHVAKAQKHQEEEEGSASPMA